MCRYATSYKPHYACFDCRKTFKRRLLSDVLDGYSKDVKEMPAKCPECGNLMADMGLDFESPKKTDTKAWKHMATLYTVGITFHSCGCSGPGYIPKTNEELIDHFSKIKEIYLQHQHFWARRKEDPETQRAVALDKNKNVEFLYRLPKKLKKGTKKRPKYDGNQAQMYWGERVRSVEDRIAFLRGSK